MIKYSEFLEDILLQAKQIQKDGGVPYLSASCIILAVIRFCREKYRGYSKYDDSYYKEEYGEEKLRYLYKKVFKPASGAIEHLWKKKIANESKECMQDFMEEHESTFEELSHMRRPAYLTVDEVFLTAVKSIDEQSRIGVREEFKGEFSVRELIEETDREIYDYVIDEIEKVVGNLQNKSQKAKELRDWRPAAKFVEPEELHSIFMKSILVKETEKEVELVFPHFFDKDDGELQLTITRFGDLYYVHDKGFAMRQLRKVTQTEEKLQRVTKRLFRRGELKDEKIVGSFCDKDGFLRYLQLVIFVANGELYYTKLDSNGLHFDYDESIPQNKESINIQELREVLRECVSCHYDEQRGLIVKVFHTYSHSSGTPSFLIESLENGDVQISDGKRGKYEGEIFENLLFRHEDLTLYSREIRKVCKKFGVVFDGKTICLDMTNTDHNAFVYGFVSFFQAALLLSEFNAMIELPYRNGGK